MGCDISQIPVLHFTVPHENPHEVQGVSKIFYLLLDLKLRQDNCSINCISCDFLTCTNILYKPFIPDVPHISQP